MLGGADIAEADMDSNGVPNEATSSTHPLPLLLCADAVQAIATLGGGVHNPPSSQWPTWNQWRRSYQMPTGLGSIESPWAGQPKKSGTGQVVKDPDAKQLPLSMVERASDTYLLIERDYDEYDDAFIYGGRATFNEDSGESLRHPGVAANHMQNTTANYLYADGHVERYLVDVVDSRTGWPYGTCPLFADGPWTIEGSD